MNDRDYTMGTLKVLHGRTNIIYVDIIARFVLRVFIRIHKALRHMPELT